MGIIKAFSGSLNGTLTDQWKDIITAGNFDEHTLVSPGIFMNENNTKRSGVTGLTGVISNGSKIYVPENTVAFIIDQGRIEEIIRETGGYEYRVGQKSIFSDNTISESVWNQTKERFSYGGQTPENKRVVFVNLREIRGIRFGTHGPQIYHDKFYGVDLEILSFGTFSIQIINPEKLIKKFIPSNVSWYSLDEEGARKQILSEFIQSFSVALNSLSSKYRISQLPAQSMELSSTIVKSSNCAGDWEDRFGFKIVSIAIENIEFTPDSRELVKTFSSNVMSMKAYDNVSQHSSNIAAQQKIAQGIQDHGLGDGAGMLVGMNVTSKLESNSNIDQQIEILSKLKKMMDSGILTEDEFSQKKKEIMGFD